MRIVRILQIVALALLVIYGVMVHNANPQLLALPGLLSLPPMLVLVGVVVLTFLLSWIPPRLQVWRRDRDVARLQRRVAELEQHVPNYDLHPTRPVIPDRAQQTPEPFMPYADADEER